MKILMLFKNLLNNTYLKDLKSNSSFICFQSYKFSFLLIKIIIYF